MRPPPAAAPLARGRSSISQPAPHPCGSFHLGSTRAACSPFESTPAPSRGSLQSWRWLANGHEPAAPQPAADAFATRDQREAAIKRAAEKFGTVAEIATCFKVDYRDLRKWARDRDSLAKGLSLKAKRIEDGLLPYCPE